MPEEEEEKAAVIEEEEEEAEVPEEEAKPGIFAAVKTKLGKILRLAIGAIVVILISVGASYLVSSYVSKDRIREIGGKIHIPPPPPYQTIDFGEYTQNIPGEDEDPHFIRIKILLAHEERDLTLSAELSKRRAQIQHIINMILSGKTKKELDTPQGKQNLAINIKQRINQILQRGKIRDVYFSSITVM